MGLVSVVRFPLQIIIKGRRVTIVTTGMAVKLLSITKVTLYAWIRDKKIAAITMESDTGRKQFVFDMREIERVKKVLKKNWKPGDKKYGG